LIAVRVRLKYPHPLAGRGRVAIDESRIQFAIQLARRIVRCVENVECGMARGIFSDDQGGGDGDGGDGGEIEPAEAQCLEPPQD